jgi:hypothetical protein
VNGSEIAACEFDAKSKAGSGLSLPAKQLIHLILADETSLNGIQASANIPLTPI